MDALGTFILEILGEIGGGRGGAINDLPRFSLGMLFWGVMLVGALNARTNSRLFCWFCPRLLHACSHVSWFARYRIC